MKREESEEKKENNGSKESGRRIGNMEQRESSSKIGKEGKNTGTRILP